MIRTGPEARLVPSVRRIARSAVFVAILLVTTGCGGSGTPAGESDSAAEDEEAPNIVFVLVDDLGARDLGAYGSSFYETSNVDRLARQGLRFTRAYAASGVCSPTRASIMSGEHPARVRITDWIPGQGDRPDRPLAQVQDRDHLPLSVETLAERLRDAGYRTAHVGKWHLGGENHGPLDQGFDVNVAGNERGSPPGYFHPYRRGDYQLTDLAATGEPGEYLTRRLGKEAADFIRSEAHTEQPFFLHLAPYAVHTPLQAPDSVVARYQARADTFAFPDRPVTGTEHGYSVRQVQSNATYAAMVEEMDRAVGRVLTAIAETGIRENTLVVFFSDNGGLSTAVDDLPTSNHPLRAGKGWLYEGGIREPLLVRWPGVTEPGTVSDMPVTSTYFLPTLVEAAGRSVPADSMDGRSLMPVLRGEDVSWNRTLYWHYPHYHGGGNEPSGAIRDGRYKLIEYFRRFGPSEVELYDLQSDPGEGTDLSEDRPELRDRLYDRLQTWRERVGAQMPEPNPNFEGVE